MATRLGDVLYRFFWAVAQAWMTLVAAGFAWDAINIYLAMVGLGLAALSWLIGYALRYVLTGGDDVMSKFNRDN
ncbi:hypothetical protein ABIF34_000941 [Bradyrhizobium japonicum]